MSLFQSLTIKPLLTAIAALALFLLLTNLGWWVHASALDLQRETAVATKDAAVAVIDVEKTEKQAWKDKARELEIANLASQKTVDHLKVELENAQGERRRLLVEGQKAIATAQVEAASADRALKNFIDRYARQLRNPDCAGALTVVQKSCPALEGY